jgi:tRNA pseudouridine13 synthase
MKLKQSPDDFVVEELTDTLPVERGPFALYRLDKTGWTTPDALAVVKRRWNIDGRRLSYGGLKDRHATTSQHFTIYRGPNRDMTHDRVRVTCLGLAAEPFTAEQIRANRFSLVLRSMDAAAIDRARAALDEVAVVGVPNYFDDQRFGSVGASREFVAREMIRGDFEAALKLALVAPYEFDRASQKREKAVLSECWHDWPACKARLERGHARSIVDYLVHHPTDFRGAVARLRPDLQGLYLSAYQSHVWNRMLAGWLASHLEPNRLASVELALGGVPAPRSISEPIETKWRNLLLPLPSARVKPDTSATWPALIESVLAEDGLTLATMKIPGLDRPYFSKGERAGRVEPAHLEATDDGDDRNRGRKKLNLKFELPRGSYATMVVKRITAVRTDH